MEESDMEIKTAKVAFLIYENINERNTTQGKKYCIVCECNPFTN
jgi:hypothetical protein